jgi:hypothetical protein
MAVASACPQVPVEGLSGLTAKRHGAVAATLAASPHDVVVEIHVLDAHRGDLATRTSVEQHSDQRDIARTSKSRAAQASTRTSSSGRRLAPSGSTRSQIVVWGADSRSTGTTSEAGYTGVIFPDLEVS